MKKLDLRSPKIKCTGCGREMDVWEIHCDASVEGILCRICSCAYATFELHPIEMEEK